MKIRNGDRYGIGNINEVGFLNLFFICNFDFGKICMFYIFRIGSKMERQILKFFLFLN